jgi:hypothetical protein
MLSPFAEYQPAAGSRVLLFQKIGAVTTQYPLLAFNETAETRQAVLTATGLWRWRLANFLDTQDFSTVDALIGKTIQFLALKEDKRPFRVSLPKNSFDENDKIVFAAELYNASYELTNEPDAQLVVTDEAGNEYPFNFGRTARAYTLDAGLLPVGSYAYRASTMLDGKQHFASGEFSVNALNIESLNLQADHNLLRLLSRETGGLFTGIDGIDQLADEIAARAEIKPQQTETIRTVSLINLKWIFFLLIGLLAAEWFSRKYMGGY